MNQRPCAEATVDVSQLDGVRLVIHPFDWISHTFRRQICASQDVLDLVLVREFVHRREEGMILRRVDMRYTGLEKRELQISHFFPVYDLGIQVETEAVDHFLDVVYCDLGIPAGIDMKY